MAPAAVTELEPGVYLGPLTSVDGDRFTIELPDGDELPAAALSVAESAFYNVAGVPDCDVVADVPTALVTEFAVGVGTLPGAYAVSAGAGFSLAYVTDVAIDFTAPTEEERVGGRTFFAWIHASEAVAPVDRGGRLRRGDPHRRRRLGRARGGVEPGGVGAERRRDARDLAGRRRQHRPGAERRRGAVSAVEGAA